mgnify:CR=1 FL=1
MTAPDQVTPRRGSAPANQTRLAVPVPTVPGAFVVNLGDMLDRMTGGRYRSTAHRVRHEVDGDAPGRARDRLSFPFFFDPSWDVEVAPLPLAGAAPDDDAASRWDGESVHAAGGTYGRYLTGRVARVFPELGVDVLG